MVNGQAGKGGRYRPTKVNKMDKYHAARQNICEGCEQANTDPESKKFCNMDDDIQCIRYDFIR